ncbi:MAG TPA: hypothetical protein VGM69_07390 [Chloroflexota bacterium]|jgi:hypothetical protein
MGDVSRPGRGQGPFVLRAPPGIDPAALELELERRLAAGDAVPTPTELPPPFAGAAEDPLERARALAARPGVEYEIGWRTPLLGQAWAGLRQVVHDEARRYVDALMARQAELDAALLEAIAELRDEVAELRAAVAELMVDG